LASALPSERDQNFLLRTATGEQFVLKIANAEEDLDFLNCQNYFIKFLAARNLDLAFPRIMPASNGADIASITTAGAQHFLRLLTWLDGVCFAEIRSPGRKLMASLGRALTQMDAARRVSHQAAHRSFHWDLRNANMARDLIGLLPDDLERGTPGGVRTRGLLRSLFDYNRGKTVFRHQRYCYFFALQDNRGRVNA
jgi:Ser/Thr protein kinase RdoA (MazF antagonist)